MKRNIWILTILATLSAVSYYFYTNKSSKSYADTFADFAIADTATVDKVVIADTQGRKLVLKREKGSWTLNDTLTPRPELVNLILRAFKDIIVQAPVAESAKEYAIKRLSTTHKLVEIYQNGSKKPTKTWYVGDPTQDHFGTIVLLELPGKGKAENPYIIEIPWHKGFITPMFFADYLEWMQTPVFVYPNLEFQSITVKFNEFPDYSYSIEKTNDSYRIKSLQSNTYLNGYDSLFLKDYLEAYKGVYYEVQDKYLTPHQTDSMLLSKPVFEISVVENTGKTNHIDIYKKFEGVRTIDLEPIKLTYDRDRYYAQLNGKQVVLIQKYAFDKLLVTGKSFIK